MAPTLQLFLLGNVSIYRDGRPVTSLPSRAAEALLIYLARQKRPVSREVLAEMLWAERSPQQALTNLRTVLSALRRELGDYLLISRETLAFNLQADFWLDADEFEQRLDRLAAPAHGAARLDRPTLVKLQAALELYRGDFLAGFALRDGPGFEEWAILEQERLRRLAHDGLRRLARHHLESGNYPAGIANAQKLLALDTYDEEALRLLMWHLARNGQRNAALAQYESTRRTLAQALGVQPAPETSQLYKRLRGLAFPPPHNLPPPATFIGRESELAELATWLARPTCRLVTLLGTGGSGKTRLALETARRITEGKPGQFLEGIFFIPLETLENAHNLALRLGAALGIPFDGSEPPHRQLLRGLKDKELLLILDNFEHLLGDDPQTGEAAALLTDILAQAPAVKLLATSRQRLNLVEEWIFDLSGLALPQAEQADPLSASAAALFVQTAQRLQRQFVPAAEEVEAIVAVCQMVQGLPLAIELAAGWTRQYRCVEIAAQVQDFLYTTQRNAPERHRSLRTVFEHSWGMLEAAAQSTFAYLSALRGDFSAEAAAALLAGEAAEGLAVLSDHSLLQRRADGRYAMHPTLRQYALEKLAADPGRQAEIQARHAHYFLTWLAGNGKAGWGDGESPEQRAVLRAEMANLRPAWEWAARQGAAHLLEGAAPVLHNFFSAESWFVEGIEAFQLALEGLGENNAGQAPLVCDLLGRQARMQIHIGQIGAARAGLERAYGLLEQVPQLDRRAAILGYQAITHYYAGDYPRAAELAGQALQLSQAAGDLSGEATALNFLGSCHKARGDYELARQSFEHAAAVYRRLPDPLGEAMVLNNLGNLAQACGDFGPAQVYYLESSSLFKTLDHAHGASTTLSNAGLLAYKQGDYAQAQALLNECLAMKQKMADRRGVAIALLRLGDVAAAVGAHSQAWEQLYQALRLAQQTEDIKLGLDILVALADLLRQTGQPAAARRLLTFVLGQSATSQEGRERANGLAQALNFPPEALQANPNVTYEAILQELLEREPSGA